jgi:hypothetical protein
MEADKNKTTEKNDGHSGEKPSKWIEKTEAWIDEAAEKLHESEAYRKADQKLESATKKLFRQAGRWWGKL